MIPAQEPSKIPASGAPSRMEACVHFLQRAVFSRSQNQPWIKGINAVIADLENLNHTTEAGFVAVGGNLMSFLTASRQLHSDIKGLTALVSGQHAREACGALVSVQGFVREMQVRSVEDGHAFATLRLAADSIHRRFSTLGKMALSFQITAILARIETAHLAGSEHDVGNLADEVASCGTNIQERVEQVLEAALAFQSRISSTLYEVARLGALQQQELPALLSAVDLDLEMFETRQQNAVSASVKLSADLDSVATDLGGIATSIQFHDITRQQVEHVVEALAAVVKDAAGAPLSTAGVVRVKVQKAQLGSASAAFCQSTRRIDRELEDIAIRVGEMAFASKRILGLDHNEKDSFLDEMQHRFEEVLKKVRDSLALENAVRDITSGFDALCQRLRAFVNQVHAIELQLSRISINAAISASHIGDSGEPLNVVATAMQLLQNECASRSTEAETDLDSIGHAIQALITEDVGRASRAGLLDNLDSRLQDLRSASASSAEAAGTIANLSDTLCANLQAARDHSGIGAVFAETIDRCSLAFDSINSMARPAWSLHAPPAVEESPDHRYTMQAERDIHEAVLSGMAPHPVEETPAAGGEDVEFF